MEDLEFSIPLEDDFSLLASMNKRLIEDEKHRNPMTIPELTERMKNWLKDREYSAYLFKLSKAVVGYCLYKQYSDHVYLRQFFVEREMRRKSIGKKAVEWLLKNSWKNQKIRIEVLTENETGMRFWRSCGFKDYSLTMEKI